MLKLVCDPFLKTGITLATLKLSGTIPVAKELLNKSSNGFEIGFFNIFSSLVGILFGPLALLEFNELMTSSSWSAVVGRDNNL